MGAVSLEERAKINHQLKKLGFGGINDPNLFAQIGTLYKTHNSLRGLLMSTRPDQRRIAYEAIKPHLCFVAKPLDVYEREIHEKAEREQWPVIERDNPHFPRPFRVQEVESEEYRIEHLAQDAIRQTEHEKQGGLELICTHCTVANLFRAKTRKDAEKEAQAEGWRWAERNGVTKTYCPKHVPGRLTMTLTCLKCDTVQRIRAWDEQDGYQSARLRGWVIQDAATCPQCAAKKLVVQ